MKQGLDYIYVPKADINEEKSSGTITKAALYFTKEYLFVLPFQSLQVLFAGMDTKFTHMKDYVDDINRKIPEMDINSFTNLMLSALKPERIYHILELDKFEIQVGFWIFGGIHIKRKGGGLQVINLQPRSLREEIRRFYGLV